MDDLFLDENLECVALHHKGTQIDEEIMVVFLLCLMSKDTLCRGCGGLCDLMFSFRRNCEKE